MLQSIYFNYIFFRFHVQPDGLVTQVESMGLAWMAGLRQGARLVEVIRHTHHLTFSAHPPFTIFSRLVAEHFLTQSIFHLHFQICKVAVSTLSHDQMVDLLKTSMAVTVTVIPPQTDGTARR